MDAVISIYNRSLEPSFLPASPSQSSLLLQKNLKGLTIFLILGFQFRFTLTSSDSLFLSIIGPNQTAKIEGRWVKMLICVPIALVRIVLFGLCIIIGYIATKCALQGWKDNQNPTPRWRCRAPDSVHVTP